MLAAAAIVLDVGVIGDQTLGRRAVNLACPQARGRLNGLYAGLFLSGAPPVLRWPGPPGSRRAGRLSALPASVSAPQRLRRAPAETDRRCRRGREAVQARRLPA
jgi:hypothetical protein